MLRNHGCALHDEGARVLPKLKVGLYAAIRRDAEGAATGNLSCRGSDVGPDLLHRMAQPVRASWPGRGLPRGSGGPRRRRPPGRGWCARQGSAR
ncbi:hypothetical protein DEJ46_00200 [Streptomyces venezuelae]|uniref:Uncharacterized protein n=1 Tax=Streptomyces venezuelae TaxID=54571 RepID=A0A5P2AID0_STRVZ|nr:hypothetical protein DEJ46_00200 [Streptomyces venezuelae]